MQIDQKRIDELLAHPSEGLNVEINDPSGKAGQAKIVCAALALWNRNGGYLIIGFDDKSLLPDLNNRPTNLRSLFHTDKIQGLISNYASIGFEIAVAFGQRDGEYYPVIVIPEGITSPVAAKADLDDGDRKLIRYGIVYCRTLNANGRPSTAAARPQDWPDIVEICFQNREADFGRFLRRQLAEQDLATLVAALQQLGHQPAPTSLCDRSVVVLDTGERRFNEAVAARTLNPEEQAVAQAGSWSVALTVDPPRPDPLPNRLFLSTVLSSNPQYTGWPVWLDSRGFIDERARPKVKDDVWEALIVLVSGDDVGSRHIDFLRLDPKGEFYLRRNLEDDVSDRIKPDIALDPVLQRVPIIVVRSPNV
jgi:hypothetical protein